MATEPVDPDVEAHWREALTRGHGHSRASRRFFGRLPSEPRCKGCNSPFRGLGGRLVAPFGFKPSRKNPNFCARCFERMPRGGAEVDLAILFADVSGSTGLAEGMNSTEYASLLDRFYHAATRVMVGHDAVIDKFIGDEVMALFFPGMCGEHYRRNAIECAVDMLHAVGYGSASVPWIPIKIGVHAGRAYAGNVGSDSMFDLTALGDTVNVAARLQGVAEAGQIVMGEGVYQEVREQFPSLREQTIEVRGKEEPVAVRSLQM